MVQSFEEVVQGHVSSCPIVHKVAGLLPFIAVCAAKDAREMHTRGGLQWALWFPVNMVAGPHLSSETVIRHLIFEITCGDFVEAAAPCVNSR